MACRWLQTPQTSVDVVHGSGTDEKPGGRLLASLEARGLCAAVTNRGGLAELLDQRTVVYCGFDPTAATLHVGNLVAVLMLARLRVAGHAVVPVVGGANAQIGDPSGRNAERVPLDVNCKLI